MFNNNPYSNYPYQSTNYGVPNYSARPDPSSTQPMAQPQPQPQPQMTMPMVQPMPPIDMPIQDIKYVNKAQAEAYIVYPNTKVMLIDKESGMVYIKTADGMGQSKTDYFRFEPINADGSPIKAQEPTPQVDFNEFVKVEQLKDFGFVTIEQYNSLAQRLEQIQKRLEGARTNVGQPKQPEARVQV